MVDLEAIGVPPRLRHCTREAWEGEWPEVDWSSPILIHGPVGTGKSHLATALLLERAESEGIHAGLRKVEDYNPNTGTRVSLHYGAYWRDILESTEALKPNGTPDETMAVLRGAELLALDDLGAERLTDFTIDRISLILRHRYNQMLATIVTTNLGLDTLAGIDGRLASRLCSGTVIGRKGKDRRVA